MELLDKNLTITLSFNTLIERLKDIELFTELIDSNQLAKEDLRYLLNKIDKTYDLQSLNKNTSLLKYIVKNELFQELVDKFKTFNLFLSLLENKKLFKELIENNRLSKEDMRYLLNKIDRYDELYDLCRNTPLIKYILNEFVLNKEIVNKLNRITNENKWCKEYNIHTLFDLIKYYNKNKEILELNELNKYAYSFDLNEEQKLEVAVLIVDNELAQNKLRYVVENDLESNYDFDSLLSYLKKKEKKSILNI